MNTKIESLGKRTIPNPTKSGDYLSENAVVTFETMFADSKMVGPHFQKQPTLLEQAGALEKIYFDPRWVSAGIVTCGGLCPGINDVIRVLVMELHYHYGVRRILGFRYGYQGLVKSYGHHPHELTPDSVDDIQHMGGTILSSSRGPQDPGEMLDYLQECGINILFCIGGDGTLRGALAIHEEAKRRGQKIAVIGIPKTIDNDIYMVQKTFGFSTAFSKSLEAVTCAHTEAKGTYNGIGLVKLMGRHSGFIAANTALASGDANFVLIPEQDFDLEGEGAFLPLLKQRLLARKHAVIIVAEGAGQKYVTTTGTDASGNTRLGNIGLFLKEKIIEYFKKEKVPASLKYIDPSYIIRSVPANPDDSVFCRFLAQYAVHAGMAGKTGMLVGMWNNIFTHVPIELATSQRKVLNPETNKLWQAVIESTGQPFSMKDRSS